MQGNYVSVAEALFTGPFLKLFPTQPANFFLAQDEDRFGDASVFESAAPRKDQQKPVALVVDDVIDVTELLSVFLSMAGYEVVTAHSAPAAIVAAQSQQFDVVISDIGMPQMNGYELAQALRATPGYEAVPLVAVTGFSMYDDHERSLRSGFNAHLTKPIDPNVLFQVIERLRS